MSAPPTQQKIRLGDIATKLFAYGCAAIIAMVFLCLIFETFRQGFGQLSWEFVTTSPQDAGRSGGILPMVVSTAAIVAVCLVFSVPIGLGTAVLLAEFSEKQPLFGLAIRTSLGVLAAVPSIVFGLFGNAFFCETLGMGYSIAAGGLTLACMVLPLFIYVAEVGIRNVPKQYGDGAAALGISKATALFKITIPAAFPGLVAGFVLAVGRALAETAALVFTAGDVERMPDSIFDSGRSLSVHIYKLSMHVAGGEPSAYGTAAVLVIMLLAINLGAMSLLRRYETDDSSKSVSFRGAWK